MSLACLEIVRENDPDRFLISLLMPRKHRAALWALYAFNYEIAKTREVVSETTIGLIRLQWWRDALAEIYNDQPVRQHEVVDALALAIKTYDLPQEEFNTLIYAREFDLEGVPPVNMDGLMNYCDFTNTSLNRLALKILGKSEDERIVKQVSQYYGLIGTLRAVPYMLKYGHMMLPQDILTKHNLSVQKINDFNKKDELIQIIKEIVDSVFDEKNQFRNDELLIKSRYIHSLEEVVKLYAYRIKTFNYDIFDPAFGTPAPLMPLTLWFKTRF